MSRSYLSKRQVEWERASLDVQEAKHKRLVTRHAETMAWMYSLCTPDYPPQPGAVDKLANVAGSE